MYSVHQDGTEFDTEAEAIEYAQQLADNTGEAQHLYKSSDDLTGADYLSVQPTPVEGPGV
jgi:hypothetical protein